MPGLNARRWTLALVLAALVAGCGVAPHVAFSIEEGGATWFYNSYDEGYYGWASFHRPVNHRLLAAICVKVLTLASGGSLERAMIAADLVLPFLVVLAACFATAVATRTAIGMGAGALLMAMAAEILAFRSVYSPTFGLFHWIEAVLRYFDPTGAGVFPQGNFTGVFWLFRTPEPQTTWIVIFLLFGAAARLVQSGERRWLGFYAGCCVLGGTGYLLAVLPVFGALCFAGMGLWFKNRRLGLELFAPALVGGMITFGLAIASAADGSSGSLVFGSRTPVVLFSGMLGLVLATFVVVTCWRKRGAPPVMVLAGTLGLAPLLMANQQLVTGRMIYLFNFENFAFAQIVAFAGVLAFMGFREMTRTSDRAPARWGLALTGAAGIALLATAGWTQAQGYYANLGVNRELTAYADAVRDSEIGPEVPVVCQDTFVADNLAIRLGWRPNYVLSRDLTFDRLIDRLDGPGAVPGQRAEFQPRLFESMALRGLTPEEFDQGFGAIVDPADPDWQSRFELGGFLYNPADFWEPLTHGRSLRREWVEAERPKLVEQYAEYLRSEDWPQMPVAVVGAWPTDEMQRFRKAFKIRRVGESGEFVGVPVRVVLIKSRRDEEKTP